MSPGAPSTTQFTPPAVAVRRAKDGSVVLRSRHALGAYARCTGEWLEHWGRHAPDRRFLVERGPNGAWRGVTYREAREQVTRLSSWLLGQDLSLRRPVMILSENSVEHGMLTLACLHIGIPVCPVSPAYSLLSRDFSKLCAIVEAVRPGVVYVSAPARFAPALAALRGRHDALVVVGSEGPPVAGMVRLDAVASGVDVEAVKGAFAAVTPDTVAKLLFTSGSTQEPKAVINTQRMLCSNQQAIAELWPFLEEPPVIVDWLPWHHTFGGNHNFNLVLRNGGTLYIDHGRPVAGEFDTTLANLRDVAPTIVFNVPRAYDWLATALRADAALRERFFSRLRLIFYAAAPLSQEVWAALGALSVQTLGRAVPMVSSWGLTETAPAATSCHYPVERAGVVGLPMPGSELKLVPTGDRLEARVLGPNVTPGYFDRPDLTARCFDEDGYFKTGDALRFVDAERPELGLLFDGRLGENFKLGTATWVHVAELRARALAALAPVALDVVVTGHDRDEVGFLIFPNVEACRRLCELPHGADHAAVLAHAAVRARVSAGLRVLAEAGGGSSTYATRALLLAEAPSIDAGEITDKGYINQRAVLTRRASSVEQLQRTPLDPAVIAPFEAARLAVGCAARPSSESDLERTTNEP